METMFPAEALSCKNKPNSDRKVNKNTASWPHFPE